MNPTSSSGNGTSERRVAARGPRRDRRESARALLWLTDVSPWGAPSMVYSQDSDRQLSR